MPLKFEFHKFESQNIGKICGFLKAPRNDYGDHLGSKVSLTTSNLSFLHIRTHICKDLSLHQILKITKNRIFDIFKHILCTKIQVTSVAQMLTKMIPIKNFESQLSNAPPNALIACTDEKIHIHHCTIYFSCITVEHHNQEIGGNQQ